MIISKTPLRMSFVGGGSDLPAFYREHGGAVLSTSVNRYVYIALNRKFDGRIRLSYSKTEEVDHFGELQHPLVREAMRLTGVEGGIEIASLADIPSTGSGLGSSSSFTVGLLNALYAHRSEYASKERLAREACQIEIERCGEPIGKQDQYAAAFGGMNLIQFHPDESVSVDPVICRPQLLSELQEQVLVFFTKRTRSASGVLRTQQEGIRQGGDRIALMRRMVELCFEMKAEMQSGSIENFGAMLHENWTLKAQLSAGITDQSIDDWYQTALRNGASGGKLLGAGHGGFLLFLAPPEAHGKIEASLEGLERADFRFDQTGSQIAFYQPHGE
jgi:D-glycero-alpha-D-manno-heptose-7-phosphate kinase